MKETFQPCVIQWNLEPPRETKIGSRNREIRNIGDKITVKQVQGRQLLVRVIRIFFRNRGFEKSGFHCISIAEIVETLLYFEREAKFPLALFRYSRDGSLRKRGTTRSVVLDPLKCTKATTIDGFPAVVLNAAETDINNSQNCV